MLAEPPQPALPAEEEQLVDFNELFSVQQGAGAPAKRGSRAAKQQPTTLAPSDLPMLELKHFAEPLRLQFGDVTMRTTATKNFVIVNETSRAQRIDVRGIETRDALKVYPASTIELDPHSQREVSIAWAPIAAGNKLGKKLRFMWNDGCSAAEVIVKGESCKRGAAASASSADASTAAAPLAASKVKRAVERPAARAPLNQSSANRQVTTVAASTSQLAGKRAGAFALPPPAPPPASGGWGECREPKPTNFRAFMASRKANPEAHKASAEGDADLVVASPHKPAPCRAMPDATTAAASGAFDGIDDDDEQEEEEVDVSLEGDEDVVEESATAAAELAEALAELGGGRAVVSAAPLVATPVRPTPGGRKPRTVVSATATPVLAMPMALFDGPPTPLAAPPPLVATASELMLAQAEEETMEARAEEAAIERMEAELSEKRMEAACAQAEAAKREEAAAQAQETAAETRRRSAVERAKAERDAAMAAKAEAAAKRERVAAAKLAAEQARAAAHDKVRQQEEEAVSIRAAAAAERAAAERVAEERTRAREQAKAEAEQGRRARKLALEAEQAKRMAEAEVEAEAVAEAEAEAEEAQERAREKARKAEAMAKAEAAQKAKFEARVRAQQEAKAAKEAAAKDAAAKEAKAKEAARETAAAKAAEQRKQAAARKAADKEAAARKAADDDIDAELREAAREAALAAKAAAEPPTPPAVSGRAGHAKLRLARPSTAAAAATAGAAITGAAIGAATGGGGGTSAHPTALVGGSDCVGGFYDEQWREKRERAYTCWINYALSESSLGGENGENGAAGAALGAGERQRLSLRELEAHRVEATYRRRVALLLREPALRQSLAKIEQQVQEGIIAVRGTVHLAADVGVRDTLLDLLQCYNPLWLRLATEAVVGEAAPCGAAGLGDAHSLRRFLDKRVLTAPAVPMPTVVGEHHEEATKRAEAFKRGTQHKAIVRRVLALIVLLDRAKLAKVLSTDPCLFLPTHAIKSSREMAQEFSRCFLSGGVGDINKHLSLLGVSLAHKQTALHEFDFGVTSLAVDLRDGVRLCRLVDACSGSGGGHGGASGGGDGRPTLVSAVRVPASTRTNKMRNVELALERLAQGGGGGGGGSGAEAELAKEAMRRQVRLLVDGHCETTLDVIWGLLSTDVLPKLAPIDAVSREVERARKAAKRAHTGISLPGKLLSLASDAASVPNRLLAWVASVCAVRGYRVHDLGVGLRDGLALCLVVRHYLPDVLPESATALLAPESFPSHGSHGERAVAGGLAPGASLSSQALKASEARLSAFNAALGSIGCVPILVGPSDAHGCGPDAHVSSLLLACLFRRITDVGEQQSAAQQLQLAWLGRHHRHDARLALRRAVRAARIQRAWRKARGRKFATARRAAKLAARKVLRAAEASRRLSQLVAFLQSARERRRHAAARTLQRAGLTFVLSRRVGTSALIVQAYARGFLQRERYLLQRVATVEIQAASRMYAAKRMRAQLREARRASAATKLQASYRRLAFYLAFQLSRHAAISIQASLRRRLAQLSVRAMRQARDDAAATAIQAASRRGAAMYRLAVAKAAAVVVQATARKAAAAACVQALREARDEQRRAEEERLRRLHAATRLQSAMRAMVCVRAFRCSIAAATLLSGAYRAHRCRMLFSQHLVQATRVQAFARGKAARSAFGRHKRAAKRIQQASRAAAAGAGARAELSAAKGAATALAAHARGLSRRKAYANARHAATSLEAAMRRSICKRRYAKAVGAAVALQSYARRQAAVRVYRTLAGAVRLQAHARRLLATRALQVARQASTAIAAAWRAVAAEVAFGVAKAAAVQLQSCARRMVATGRLTRQRSAAVALQAAGRRGFAAKKASTLRLARQSSAALRLQSRQRSRAQARRLLLARKASVRIQALARRRSASQAVAKLRTARQERLRSEAEAAARRKGATTLQAATRRMLAVDGLKLARGAATTIAAAWRARSARKALAVSLAAAQTLQAIARGRLGRRVALKRRAARATIVRSLCGLLALRREVRSLSATLIQAVWRGASSRVLLAAEADAASRIAACWRGLCGVRRHSECKRACGQLQQATRLLLARRRMRAMRLAATKLQTAARGGAARALAATLRAEAARRALAATALQCLVRRKIALASAAALRQLMHLANIALLHRMARFVQSFVRFRQALQRRVAAASKLGGFARTLASVRRLVRIKFAVRRLQARARARRLRSRIYAKRPELRAIAERCARAREAAIADPRLWLCNRTNVALHTLLSSKVLGEVLRAVASLEMFTLIAKNVCERMVAEGAVPVLFNLLSTSNRSVPSQKIVGHGLRALLNIAKCDPRLCEALTQQKDPDALVVLVDLAYGAHRDKANHGKLWDALALLSQLLTTGPASYRTQLAKGQANGSAECTKRLEFCLTRLQAAAPKDATNTRGAATGAATGARGSAAAPAARKAAVAPAVRAGRVGAKAVVSAEELGPKCIGSLRTILTAMGK